MTNEERQEHETRKRMANWLRDHVLAGGVTEFAFVAITDKGGKVEFRTPRAPKTFTKRLTR